MRSDFFAYAIGVLTGGAALLASSGLSAQAFFSPPMSCPQIVQNCQPYPVAYIDNDNPDDQYFEGYIQGVVDSLYSEYRINVIVQGSTVYLANAPCDHVIVERVVGMVYDIPGVKCVRVCKDQMYDSMGCHEKQIFAAQRRMEGEWMPPYGSLFQPLIADPRQVSHTAALRLDDQVFGPTLAAVSFGNELPIYRWFDMFTPGGMMQIGVESGIFAVFKLGVPSMDLQNADYYLGFPLTYTHGCWSYRLRLYHISSHLGDEFLVLEDHPGLVRVNPSFEALDLFASYQLTKHIRVFGGVGAYLASDETYPQDVWYVAYGFEVRILGGRDTCHKLYWQPVIAVYSANRQFQDWKFDLTCFAGVEVGRNEFIGNRARLGVEYHDGFAVEGQFQKFRTTWTSIKLSYYF